MADTYVDNIARITKIRSVDSARLVVQGVLTTLATMNRPGMRNILVTHQRGTLVLSGQVRSYHEKQLATEICRQGADGFLINNNITVVDDASSRLSSDDRIDIT